jgi:TonB-linked SusC/RagA family outer membrane protein
MKQVSIFCLLCVLFGPSLLSGQAANTGRVMGAVTAATTGQPLPGATVTVQGTNVGTLSAPNGRFILTGVPVGVQTIQVSLIGYGPQTQSVTVSVDEPATINFQLTSQAVLLEGIVAVGYGTQQRRDVTGSVASVRADAITQVVGANPMDAIKGRLPGVDVRANSFEPGAATTVRIRGARSIQASNNPLIVVDGVPVSGDLRDVDANNIESIEVLKDAAAAAVYGSRAANGVLLITTKRGRSGGTVVDYSVTYGASNVLRKPDMMDGEQFANYRREAYRAGGHPSCENWMANPGACDLVALDALMRQNLASGISTDWQDEILRTGQLQQHQLAISGGDENTRFRAAVGFLDQTGITITQGYDARNGSLSLTHDFGRLNLSASVQGSQTVREAGRGSGIWDEALFNAPLGRVRDEEGQFVFLPTEDGLRVNPVQDALENRRDLTRTNVLGTVTGSLELTEGVRMNVSFGPQYASVNDGWFIGRFTRMHRGSRMAAGQDNTRTRNYTLSNYLNVDRLLGDRHRVHSTLLYEIAGNRTTFDSLSARDLPYAHQLWYELQSGADPIAKSWFSETAMQSYMGRVNYTLDDKYTVSLVGRVDGSSVLAEGNKYAFFPAAAFSWQIGDEPFMANVPAFNELKLRLSYGRQGNSSIGAYETLGRLGSTWYNFGHGSAAQRGYYPGSIPNPDLRWEATDQYNFGLDFGLLRNRISGAIDVYQQNTHDLLLPRALPYTSGHSSVLQNVGKTRNQGFELALSSVNLTNWNGIDWETDLSFSRNRNQIIALADGMTEDIGSNRWVGQPIQVNYNYRIVGIWQEHEREEAAAFGARPGDVRPADLNGDGRFTGDDRTFLGNHLNFPDWVGSLNNRVRFRNLDLSVLATTRQGYMVGNAFVAAYNNLAGRYNNLNVDYWTPENPSNQWPRPNVNGQNQYYGAMSLQDGSHVRIRDITLGYSLPESLRARVGTNRARLYVKAQDPFLFTSSEFVGWDPEGGFNLGNTNFADPMMDQGSPAFRSLLFGMDVAF